MNIELEKSAMRGDPMPKSLNVSEQLAYLSMRNLYERFKQKLISSADAKVEKQIINNTLEQNQTYEDLLAYTRAMWTKIDEAGTAYAKEPTIENAEVFYAAVYNLPKNWRKEAISCQGKDL